MKGEGKGAAGGCGSRAPAVVCVEEVVGERGDAGVWVVAGVEQRRRNHERRLLVWRRNEGSRHNTNEMARASNTHRHTQTKDAIQN